MAKVLCIDDDRSIAQMTADIVEFHGHDPIVVTRSMDVVTFFPDLAVKAIFADYMMPLLDGLELLAMVQERRPDIRRILLTAAPEEQAVKEALAAGLIQLLYSKPPSIADVKLALAWLPGMRPRR